jgi:hypothetical protein
MSSTKDNAVSKAQLNNRFGRRVNNGHQVETNGTDPGTPTGTRTRELIGNVAVETGQNMVIDPCYAGQINYEDACEVTLTEGAGSVGIGNCDLGAVTGTAFGDGCYDVYLERINGRPYRLVVDLGLIACETCGSAELYCDCYTEADIQRIAAEQAKRAPINRAPLTEAEKLTAEAQLKAAIDALSSE